MPDHLLESERVTVEASAWYQQIAQIRDTLSSARLLQSHTNAQLRETQELLIRSDKVIVDSRRLLAAQQESSAWLTRQHDEWRKVRACVAALNDALAHCRYEDVRTLRTYAALQFLESKVADKWPFQQFREGMEQNGSRDSRFGRWQVLNASLNAIKAAIIDCGNHNGGIEGPGSATCGDAARIGPDNNKT